MKELYVVEKRGNTLFVHDVKISCNDRNAFDWI